MFRFTPKIKSISSVCVVRVTENHERFPPPQGLQSRCRRWNIKNYFLFLFFLLRASLPGCFFLELIRKTWNVLGSVQFRILWKQQPISYVGIMKWIILAFLLISLSTLSHSLEPVAADYGACPEEEYRSKELSKRLSDSIVWFVTMMSSELKLTFDPRNFFLWLNKIRSDLHDRFRHHRWMS